MAQPILSNARLLWQKCRFRLLAWSALFFLLVSLGLGYKRAAITQEALSVARLACQRDITYRLWVSKQGGVYVPSNQPTPPNPYLAHLAERDIKTTQGKDLTLINPAYLMRLVHGSFSLNGGLNTHLTSDRPLRPENLADSWEKTALQKLRQERISETWSIEPLDGQQHLRFMSAFITQESCLKCHAHQGYRLGDSQGGISISVPLKALSSAILQPHYLNLLAGQGLLWLLGTAGILFWTRREIHHYSLQEMALLSLKDQQEIFQSIIQATDDGFILYDENGVIKDVNPAYIKTSGYSKDEVVGKSLAFLNVGATAEEIQTGIQDYREADYHRFRTTHLSKAGKRLEFEVTRRYSKTLRLFFAFLRNISKEMLLREAHKAAANSPSSLADRLYFRTIAQEMLKLLEAEIAFVGEWDVEKHFKLLSLKSYPPLDLPPDWPAEAGPWTGSSALEPHLHASGLQDEFPDNTFFKGQAIEGYAGLPLFNSKNEATGLLGVFFKRPLEDPPFVMEVLKVFAHRTSEELNRLKADLAIQESEKRFRTAIGKVDMAVVMVDTHSQLTFANKYFLDLTGFPWVGIEGKDFFKVFLGQENSPVATRWRQSMSLGKPLKNLEFQVRTLSGQNRQISWSVTELINAEGEITGAACLGVETTEQQRLIKALQDLEFRYRLISENTQDVIWVMDLATQRISYISPSIMRWQGLHPADILTQELSAFLTPDSLQNFTALTVALLENWNRPHQTLAGTVAMDFLCPDGSVLPTLAHLSLLRDDHDRPTALLGVNRVAAPEAGHPPVKTSEEVPATATAQRIAPDIYEPPSHRILFVDDDPLLRTTMPLMLDSLGHTCIPASSGQEAIEKLETGLESSLVILDLNMPGMSGAECLERLRQIRPNIPIIIATGLKGAKVDALVKHHPNVSLLLKPYSSEELQEALSEYH